MLLALTIVAAPDRIVSEITLAVCRMTATTLQLLVGNLPSPAWLHLRVACCVVLCTACVAHRRCQQVICIEHQLAVLANAVASI